jgi:hypothetical protein
MSDAFKTEQVTAHGITVQIEYFYDDTYSGYYPWEEFDGHVNIQTKRVGYYGRVEKSPSEVIFYVSRDTVYYYDIREAHAKARAEEWGCKNPEGLTKKEIAARAVAENVKFWRGYLNDDWHYVGVVCTVLDSEGEETNETESCWGFETVNGYHETAGREMAESLAESVHKARLCQWRSVLREARQRKYWASRDVVTVGGM